MPGQQSLIEEVDTNEYLGYLYPLMRIERESTGVPVEAADLGERALHDGAFPLLGMWQANLREATREAAEWMRWIDPDTGIPRTVKTPERGRIKPAEASREETLFDLDADVRELRGGRSSLRKRIRAFYFRFREQPPGLPEWLWSLADHQDMLSRLPGMSGAAVSQSV